MERDIQLDIYRAVSMIYVVCFIHVIFWLKIGSEPFISIVLFEMPAIFFIAGAAASVSGNKRSLRASFLNRAKRVILPYYIYALVSILILALCTLAYHTFHIGYLETFDLSRCTIRDIVAMLLCRGTPLFPFVYHLWFIIPYMIISCSTSYQIRVIEHIGRNQYFALCVLLFAICSFRELDILKEVSAYNLFYISGLLYYKKMKLSVRAIILTILATLLVILVAFGFTFTPMQANKFPPNVLFVVYGFIALIVLSVVLGRFNIANFKLLQLWNKRGYTIYLYQNFVYIPLNYVFSKMGGANLCVRILALSVMCFVLSTLLSYITTPIENALMKRFFK